MKHFGWNCCLYRAQKQIVWTFGLTSAVEGDCFLLGRLLLAWWVELGFCHLVTSFDSRLKQFLMMYFQREVDFYHVLTLSGRDTTVDESGAAALKTVGGEAWVELFSGLDDCHSETFLIIYIALFNILT